MAKVFGALAPLVLAVVLIVGTASAADVNTGVVGYWPMDGNANDRSGAGNDGELIGGPEWVAGHKGQAIKLAGEAGGEIQHVSVPGFSLVSDTVTWAAWLNGSSNHNWTGIMISRGTAIGGPNDNGIGFGDGTALHYTWTGNTTWNWHSGPVIPQDTWTMVAVSLDPALATAYVYTDADGLQSVVSSGYSHPAETIENLRFGWDECCDAGARWFGGMMDELLIYDRALAEEDILELAINGPTAVESGDKLATTWGDIK